VSAPPRLAILGPQRHRPTLSDVLLELDVPGDAPIATITAGWEEREDEIEELGEHLGGRMVHLGLYARSEAILRRDHELRTGVRWRTQRLREAQELYRIRLSRALDAARELLRREPSASGADLLAAERASAIDTLRTLDDQHAALTGRIREEFIARWTPLERPGTLRHRAEVEGALADCPAICVAGGHVAVLLDILRLFDFPTLVGERTLVAWSAGAMALSERVVLFHDSPPQGPSSAEVLEDGLGIVRGLLPLPHARHRLNLDDPRRVALFALRFRPLLCAPLDDSDRVFWTGERWSAPTGSRRLLDEGTLTEIGA
jgi:hypothetical protein